MACVPAGALAGAGFVEFNWVGPPYDGGFMGDLVLFGGFLALGQASFVFFFVLRLCGGTEGRPWTGYVVAGCSALLWTLMGFVGLTAGSYYEVGFETSLYSNLGVLAGILPWLFVGVLEGVVLVVAALFAALVASLFGNLANRDGTRSRLLVVIGVVEGAAAILAFTSALTYLAPDVMPAWPAIYSVVAVSVVLAFVATGAARRCRSGGGGWKKDVLTALVLLLLAPLLVHGGIIVACATPLGCGA